MTSGESGRPYDPVKDHLEGIQNSYYDAAQIAQWEAEEEERVRLEELERKRLEEAAQARLAWKSMSQGRPVSAPVGSSITASVSSSVAPHALIALSGGEGEGEAEGAASRSKRSSMPQMPSVTPFHKIKQQIQLSNLEYGAPRAEAMSAAGSFSSLSIQRPTTAANTPSLGTPITRGSRPASLKEGYKFMPYRERRESVPIPKFSASGREVVQMVEPVDAVQCEASSLMGSETARGASPRRGAASPQSGAGGKPSRAHTAPPRPTRTRHREPEGQVVEKIPEEEMIDPQRNRMERGSRDLEEGKEGGNSVEESKATKGGTGVGSEVPQDGGKKQQRPSSGYRDRPRSAWLRYYVPVRGASSHGMVGGEAEGPQAGGQGKNLQHNQPSQDSSRHETGGDASTHSDGVGGVGGGSGECLGGRQGTGAQAGPLHSDTSSPSKEYHKTSEVAAEIQDIARDIGLDPAQDEGLMWIAEEYFLSHLPEGWAEFYDPQLGKSYYFNFELNHTTWDHPLEGYYKGLVYMKKEGEGRLRKRAEKSPPQPDEVAAMCQYFNVDLESEPFLSEIMHASVNAPLPSGWKEDEENGVTVFIHNSNFKCTQHPMDAYFIHKIRMERSKQKKMRPKVSQATGDEGEAETQGTAGEAEAEADTVSNEQMLLMDHILANFTNEYQCLSLDRKVLYTKADVRSRYRTLALQCHPDKCKSQRAHLAFQVLTAAFKKVTASLSD